VVWKQGQWVLNHLGIFLKSSTVYSEAIDTFEYFSSFFLMLVPSENDDLGPEGEEKLSKAKQGDFAWSC